MTKANENASKTCNARHIFYFPTLRRVIEGLIIIPWKVMYIVT